MNTTLDPLIQKYMAGLESLSGHSFYKTAALQSAVTLANLLGTLTQASPDKDILGDLAAFFARHASYLGDIAAAKEALEGADGQSAATPGDTDAIFGAAWTTFDRKSYDHSVSLVMRRLKASGITAENIRGRRCFDGGCGIGRLSSPLASTLLGPEGEVRLVITRLGRKA
jgi:hypothetical protein